MRQHASWSCSPRTPRLGTAPTWQSTGTANRRSHSTRSFATVIVAGRRLVTACWPPSRGQHSSRLTVPARRLVPFLLCTAAAPTWPYLRRSGRQPRPGALLLLLLLRCCQRQLLVQRTPCSTPRAGGSARRVPPEALLARLPACCAQHPPQEVWWQHAVHVQPGCVGCASRAHLACSAGSRGCLAVMASRETSSAAISPAQASLQASRPPAAEVNTACKISSSVEASSTQGCQGLAHACTCTARMQTRPAPRSSAPRRVRR